MNHLTSILDKVASELESRGLRRLASELDVVANTLDMSRYAFRPGAILMAADVADAYTVICADEVKAYLERVLHSIGLYMEGVVDELDKAGLVGEARRMELEKHTRQMPLIEYVKENGEGLLSQGKMFNIGYIDLATGKLVRGVGYPGKGGRVDDFLFLNISNYELPEAAFYASPRLVKGLPDQRVVLNLTGSLSYLLWSSIQAKLESGSTYSLEREPRQYFMSMLPSIVYSFSGFLRNLFSHELTHFEQDLDGTVGLWTERARSVQDTSQQYKMYRMRDFEVEPEAVRSSIASYLMELLKEHSPQYIDENVDAPEIQKGKIFYDAHSQSPEDVKDVVSIGKRWEKHGLMTRRMAKVFEDYLKIVLQFRGAGKRRGEVHAVTKGSREDYLSAIDGWSPRSTFMDGRFLSFWRQSTGTLQ